MHAPLKILEKIKNLKILISLRFSMVKTLGTCWLNIHSSVDTIFLTPQRLQTKVFDKNLQTSLTHVLSRQQLHACIYQKNN